MILGLDERKTAPAAFGEWNKKHTLKLYEKNGDIFLEVVPKQKIVQLTHTVDRESGPRFSADEMRGSLELIIRYTAQQGLIPRAFAVDELFDDVTRTLG